MGTSIIHQANPNTNFWEVGEQSWSTAILLATDKNWLSNSRYQVLQLSTDCSQPQTMTASESTPTETSLFKKPLKRIVRFFQYAGDTRTDHPPEHVDVTLEPSEVFDLLKPERRRALMDVLAISESPVSVSSLAEEVAAIEYESAPEELDSAQRKRVYIALCQVHLPRLAEAKVVSYDDDRKIVEEGEKFRQLRHVHTVLAKELRTE
jgi:hypothetical protein